MKVWTLSRYARYCKDTNEGLVEAAADNECSPESLAFEVAQSCLDMEPTLKDFILLLGSKDVLGTLADDICFPGNCKNYKIEI